jgi:hypothetical protein
MASTLKSFAAALGLGLAKELFRSLSTAWSCRLSNSIKETILTIKFKLIEIWNLLEDA